MMAVYNYNVTIEEILDREFREVFTRGDVEGCRQIIVAAVNRRHRFKYYVDCGSIALQKAVKNDEFEMVRFLLEAGANPRYRGRYNDEMDAVELAAFRSSSNSEDPRILDLLLERLSDDLSLSDAEVVELRGCGHVVDRRLDSAFDCLFGTKDDEPADVHVAEGGSFEKKLVDKCLRVLIARYSEFSTVWMDWVREYVVNRPADERNHTSVCAKMVEFLVRETDFSYYFVFLVFSRYFNTRDLTEQCEVMECLSTNVDPERNLFYLEKVVVFVVSNLSIPSMNHQMSDDLRQLLLIRLAESVKKFPFKDKLFATYLNQFVKFPFLERLRFLIEYCGLDPNSATCSGDKLVRKLYRISVDESTSNYWYRGGQNYYLIIMAEFEEALKILLKNGLHLCCRTQLFEEFEQRLGNYDPPRIPRLECLAASAITRVKNMDASKLLPNKRLREFVLKLH